MLLNHKASYKDFEPTTWVSALVGKELCASDLSKSLNLIQRAARQIGEFFERFDVLLTPVLAAPPLVAGASQIKGFQLMAMKFLGRLNAGGVINRFSGIDVFADQVFEFAAYTPLFNVPVTRPCPCPSVGMTKVCQLVCSSLGDMVMKRHCSA